MKPRRKYSKDEINEARFLYTTTEMTLKDVGEKLEMPYYTLTKWSRAGKWSLFRELGVRVDSTELEALRMDRAEMYNKMLEDVRELWEGNKGNVDQLEKILRMIKVLTEEINVYLLLGE